MFIEPGHSVIDPAPPAYALLSQNFRQHLKDLLWGDFPVLDQADHDPHMLDERLRPRWVHGPRTRDGLRRCLLRFGRPNRSALGVLRPLLVRVLAVEIHAPLRGLLLAVGVLAAEGTTQILASRIARMGDEKNAAVPASGQAPSQVRPGSHHRSHELVVLQDQLPDLRPAIPVPSKRKMLRDRYGKKPKLSLRMLASIST
jgi:hypothetical protein